MALYRNEHGGMIVLPDGVEVANGATAEIGADMVLASGVAALIEAGGLVRTKADKQGKSEKTPAEIAAEAKAAADAEAAAIAEAEAKAKAAAEAK